MSNSLSPKQVARAIDVSESSVKRWCDSGILVTHRTAGGHRRIRLPELLRFLRQRQQTIVRPEIVGLPATTGQTSRVLDRAREQFRDALVEGDGERCRQIAFDLYLAKHSISTICDHVIAYAFHAIGDLWQCGEVEVYQERRGCEVCARALHDLRRALPSPSPSAPRAMGGTPEGDHYTLPTMMAELVLRDGGWQSTSIGSSLPFQTIRAAIVENQPALFWLSVSFVPDLEQFAQQYSALYESVSSSVALAVGGRALTEEVRDGIEYTVFCENMRELESFARTMRNFAEAKS